MASEMQSLLTLLLFAAISICPVLSLITLRGEERHSRIVQPGHSEVDMPRPISLGVVVVRCTEGLDWLKKMTSSVPLPFSLKRIHVVEKCTLGSAVKDGNNSELRSLLQVSHAGAISPLVTVSHLRNIGFQVYGYVSYIVDQYKHLDDYTAFMSGSPDSSFNFDSFPQFLDVALVRGYAALGYHYEQSNTNGFVLMESCPGRGVPLHDTGVTVSVLGAQFIASRSAVQFNPIEGFLEYLKCFESLPEVKRPPGLSKMQWKQMVPGASERAKFELYGHMLFGAPRIIADQRVMPGPGHLFTAYPRLVLPLSAVVPLSSPFRLVTMFLALTIPVFLVLWECNRIMVQASKRPAPGVVQETELWFHNMVLRVGQDARIE